MDRHDTAWQAALEALRAYVAAHGALPLKVHPSGLGDWVGNQPAGKKTMDEGKGASARHGMAPARAAALEAVPRWSRGRDFDAAWRKRLWELEAHLAAHGRLPPFHLPGLGTRITNQRHAKRMAASGRQCGRKMPPERAAVLEAVPGWTWDELAAAGQEKLAELEAHGALPPQGDASGLGKWVHNQRQAMKALEKGNGAAARCGMPPERAAALEAVPGWVWEARQKRRRPETSAAGDAALGDV
jgi:hypothetical protein